MKQLPLSLARVGWTGQRPMTSQELREKRRRIEQKARALHVASLPHRVKGGSPDMDKDTFINRYMEKVITLLGVTPSTASDMAETAFDDWDGVDTPEECAEDEASYWGE